MKRGWVVPCALVAAVAAFAVDIVDGTALTVASGETAALAEIGQATVPYFDVDGTLTIGSGATFTVSGVDTRKSYLGRQNANATMVVGPNAVLDLQSFDKNASNAGFAIGYKGGTGALTISSGATFFCKGRLQLVRNGSSAEERVLPSRAYLTLAGSFTSESQLELGAYAPNDGALKDQTNSYTTVSTVTFQDGGVMEIPYIQANDYARNVFNIDGNATIRARNDRAAADGGFQIGTALVEYFIADGKTLTFDTQGHTVVFAPKNSNNYTNIRGAGGLVKTGSGTLRFFPRAAEDLSFTGPITVAAGTLYLGKPLEEGQTVLVKSGAKFEAADIADLDKVTYENPDDAPTAGGLYTVNADLPNGLDLLALDDYAHDRLGGPTVDGLTATVTGTVTHDAATTEAPFHLIGQAANTTLKLVDTGLDAIPVSIEGLGTIWMNGDRTVTAANKADFAVAPTATYQQGTNFYALTPEEDPFVVDYSLRANEFFAGFEGTSGYVVVKDGGKLKSDSYTRIGAGSDKIRANYPANISVTNGTLEASQFRFSPYGLTNGADVFGETPYATLTLEAESVTRGTFYRNDDPTARVIFAGGTAQPWSSTGSNLFDSNQNGKLQVEAKDGNPIDLNLEQACTNMLAYANKEKGVQFLGDGDLVKRGAGLLRIGNTTKTDWSGYTGDIRLAGGTIALTDDNPLPSGEGKGVMRQSSGTFDLGGHTATLNDFEFIGGGYVRNGTLRLGADNRDFIYQVAGEDNLNVGKVGTGTMTLGQAPRAGVTVEEGTLKLGRGAPQAYSQYRFQVRGVWGSGANSMQISEFKLLCNGEDVTRTAGVVASRAATGSAPGNEGPEKAIDGDLNTKFLDFNGATNSQYPDDCYLQLAYPEPITVTHYTWATANDEVAHTATCRLPKRFRLFGSNDGATWDLLDDRYEYIAVQQAKVWIDDVFALGGAEATRRASLQVQPNGKVEVASADALVKNLVKGAGEIAIPAGSRLTVLGETCAATGFTGAGELVLAPAGDAAVLAGGLAFPGTVRLANGTTTIGLGSELANAKYFKLVIRQTQGSDNCMQFSEFALYDATGNRLNQGLAFKGSLYDPTQLAAGECCRGAAYSAGKTTEDAGAIFDGSVDTKWCANNNNMVDALDDESKWRIVYMRLADDAAPAASYNFWTANDSPNRTPKSWSLFASNDGQNWALVDERIGAVVTTAYKTIFQAANYEIAGADESASPGTASYQVDAGATLVVNENESVASLTVDFAAEDAGTITSFTPAVNGRLYLVNVPQGAALGKYRLPLHFANVPDARNAYTWKVYVNGELRPYLFSVTPERVGVLTGKGLALFLR